MKRLLALDEMITKVSFLKSSGNVIVSTNGVFDILHLGHCRYLKKAKDLGDFLVVGVNSDSSVKRIKDKDRPVNNENERAEVLTYFEAVDYVFIFDEDNPIEFIKKLKPDIHVKGGDYRNKPIIEEETVKSYGGKIELIDFESGYSTTSIIDKIKSNPNYAFVNRENQYRLNLLTYNAKKSIS